MAHIAVVDDNHDAREVIRIWLEINHDVEEFGSAEAFLSALKVGDFDIALVDIKMPHVDGIMLARIVRGELGLSLPLIAITAHVINNINDVLYRAGFNQVITKPMDLAVLSRVIEDQLADSSDALGLGSAGAR